MNLETALRGVQMGLDRLTSGGVLEIAFFGGEPLLHWFRVRDVVHRCETDIGPRYPDRKIRYHITSNLAYLPPDLIGWARRHQVTFLCDVDGPAAVHDQCRPYKGGRPSHRDVVANVRRLADAGLKVSLRATLTALNQHHMMDIAQHHKEIGGCSSAFVPVCPVDSDEYTFPAAMLPSPEVVTEGLVQVYQSRVWDRETLFPFSAYSTKIKPGAFVVTGCGAPYGNTPVVDVDGRVYPCLYLMGTSEFLLGDVHHGNPLDAPCLEELFRRLHVDQVEGCRECAWRYVCGGGCPVWRLLVLSRTDADPAAKEYCRRINCHFTRKILETLLWDMAGEAVRRGAGTPIDTAPPNGESLYCV
jgi:uncharacterized protein